MTHTNSSAKHIAPSLFFTVFGILFLLSTLCAARQNRANPNPGTRYLYFSTIIPEKQQVDGYYLQYRLLGVGIILVK